MSHRLLAAALLGAGLLLVTTAPAADKNAEASKKALSELGDFIGQWKGSGEPVVNGKKGPPTKETWGFGWKFPKDAADKEAGAYIAIEVADSKLMTKGALKYDPAKKVYLLTAEDKDGTAQDYTGKIEKSQLVLTRTDAATKDLYKLTLNTVADGVRMNVKSEIKTGGKGLFADQYKLSATKEGESFAGGGGKKNECVVTGGLGTMPVSFNGKQYYVCCSGCREEFMANPKKYVDEFEKNKKK